MQGSNNSLMASVAQMPPLDPDPGDETAGSD